MTDLAQAFTHWESQRAFEQQLAGRIRARDFAGAERAIAGALNEYPSAFTELCARTPVPRLENWFDLQADFLEADEWLLRRENCRCTLVALDVVNRLSAPELHLESQFYGGSDELAAELTADQRAERHRWKKAFGVSGRLRIVGLDELVSAQHAGKYVDSGSFYGERAPGEYIGAILANWFILLRIHQAVMHHLSEHGLPRSLPVLCGVDTVPWPMESGDWDYGPWFEAVYGASIWSRDESTVAAVLRERAAQRKADYEAETDRMVAELVEKRSILRRWWPWIRPSERRNAIELAEMSDRLLFEHVGTRDGKPSWRMNGREFADLAARVRNWRDRGRDQSQMKPVPPANRTELHEMFVQDGIAFGGRWARMNVLYDRELLRDGEHPLQTGGRVQ